MPATILGDQALTLPNGTLANRPATPALGTMRYNTTNNGAEVYTVNGWAAFGDLPGYSPSAPAESAVQIQTANPSAANGFYWIRQTGSTAYQTYCVFTNAAGSAIAGGPWTVPLVFNRTSLEMYNARHEPAVTVFKDICATVGISTPGRGMESSRTTTEVYGAWLATKRAMWNAHSSFISGKSTGVGGVLVMPVLKNSSGTVLTVHDRSGTHIPPNGDGDRCDGSAFEIFCGWWGTNDVASWTTNNDSIPGPEDWPDVTNTTYGYTGFLPLVVACTYK